MAASVEQQQKKQHFRTLELQEVTTDMKDLSVGPSSVSSSSSSCSESVFLDPIHRGASATTTTTATPVLEPFIRNSSRNMAKRTNDDVKKLVAAIPIPRGRPSGDQNHDDEDDDDDDDDDNDNNNNNQAQLHKNQHFRDKIQATLLYQDKVDAMAVWLVLGR